MDASSIVDMVAAMVDSSEQVMMRGRHAGTASASPVLVPGDGGAPLEFVSHYYYSSASALRFDRFGQIGHFDRANTGVEAFITGLGAAAFDCLFDIIGGNDTV